MENKYDVIKEKINDSINYGFIKNCMELEIKKLVRLIFGMIKRCSKQIMVHTML